MVCSKCGFDNPQSFAFCGHCGTSTTLTIPVREVTDSQLARAERRQLSVMFCDMVGSTTLSGQLDPEELSEVTRAYHSLCAEVVERHAGRVAQFMGDGLLVYFGYPLSHEDDAQRAIHAGLEIVAAVASARERLGQPLQVRVAVHTGLAVVGQLGGEANPDPMAISGETPNIAARLQSIAEPDQVVISAATHKLIQGFFVCRSLGTPALKGVSIPIEVFEVIEPTGIHTRFERAVFTGLTPFVSREQEVGQLRDRWQRARDGSGQVVMLSGEAGIGKSRLVQMLAARTAGESALELACHCSPYYQNSALYPAVELLQRMLRFNRNDDSSTKLAKLEAALAQAGFSLPEMVPLFAALLSLPANGRYPTLPMSPPRQKQKTFEAIIEWLMRGAKQAPTRLIVEDLHWADPSTLELIDLLIERVTNAPFLLLLVFRPDFQPHWSSPHQITSITLGRLPQQATELLIQSAAGGKQLPVEVVNEIVAKTDGVPLFVEELTRMVLESGLVREQEGRYVLTSAMPSLAIPSTLYDSLMARLDRLGTAKEVAQLAATIGKEFSYELLRAVSPLEETRLTGALNRLVDAELLNQTLEQKGLRYCFRHALIRDAAYDSLLRSQRRQYHRRLAEVLREQFAETTEAWPAIVANHLTEAGMVEQAIPFWQRAGQQALERSANKEAIQHLTKGLDLLGALPESPQRFEQELLLCTTLGPALIATGGFASAEVEKVYARARQLCQRVSEAPQLFHALWGSWVFYVARAEHETAWQLGELCLRLGQSARDPALLLEANHALGVTFLGLAQHARGLQHLEQGIALYNPSKSQALAFLYGQDPGVVCLSHAAWALWFLGYADRAVKRNAEALALARRLSHKHTLVAALDFSAWFNQLSVNCDESQEHADAAIALAVEQGFPFWEAMGLVLRGWTRAHYGSADEGIAEILRGLNAYRASGANTMQPYYLGLLADAYGMAGRPEDALKVVAEGLALVNKTGERYYEPELYRLRGEFALCQSETASAESERLAQAEESFLQALRIAREQSTKFLELRAALSLGRLWLRRSSRAEARRLVTEVLGWFTEGFDTADLRAAKSFLEES
jgi:class 3 adenylate cyclase/predicted ATPase